MPRKPNPYCPRCKELKTPENTKVYKKKLAPYCITCHREYYRVYMYNKRNPSG